MLDRTRAQESYSLESAIWGLWELKEAFEQCDSIYELTFGYGSDKTQPLTKQHSELAG